jgi:alkylation response protein AidB-like acyl-CoA dehydrogenase
MGEAGCFDPGLWTQIAELGWNALTVPEENEGLGMGLVDLLVLAEEHGRLCQPGLFLSTACVAMVLGELGSPAQRAEWLPKIGAGECKATWAHYEPEGGWGPDDIALQAKNKGDGWVLSGSKRLVSDAVDADLFLVSAQTDDGPALFLVPASAAGIGIEPHTGLDLARTLAAVAFDSVAVKADARMPLSDARAGIERALQIAIVLQCGESLGVSEALLEMTVEYSKGRVQFNRPIGSFQVIRHKCADMRIALDGTRTFARYAALAVQERSDDAAEAVHAAKSHIGDATSYMAGEALQIHGGVGFTWEYDVHYFLRRAKSNQVLWGDPTWHNERLARIMIG